MTDNNRLFAALPSVDIFLKALATGSAPDDTGNKKSQDAVRVRKARNTGKTEEEDADRAAALTIEVCGQAVPRSLVKEQITVFLDICRTQIRDGVRTDASALSATALWPELKRFIQKKCLPQLQKVLNATGVIVHTNLGRSVLAEEAVEAVLSTITGYSNLEFNLDTGVRGSRYSHVEELICALTGAEAAVVVNNNAAAVLLVLDTFCKGKEVIISRGELVEVGGSFRIPDIMKRSQCELCEVGATNITRISDYDEAITDQTAALLRVHMSNYRIVGFHKQVLRQKLVELGHSRGIPVFEDLGSGFLCDLAKTPLAHLVHDEPTVQKIIADGIDIAMFSGDKVLGGPQAGIIAGKASFINKIKKNQLNRALRPDKMTLAALEATLRLYKEPELAMLRIPTLAMMCLTHEELEARADTLLTLLDRELSNRKLDAAFVSIEKTGGMSMVGGGAFPERGLPTTVVTLRLKTITPENFKKALLQSTPPLVVTIDGDKICFDVRTLAVEDLPLVADGVAEALEQLIINKS